MWAVRFRLSSLCVLQCARPVRCAAVAVACSLVRCAGRLPPCAAAGQAARCVMHAPTHPPLVPASGFGLPPHPFAAATSHVALCEACGAAMCEALCRRMVHGPRTSSRLPCCGAADVARPTAAAGVAGCAVLGVCAAAEMMCHASWRVRARRACMCVCVCVCVCVVAPTFANVGTQTTQHAGSCSVCLVGAQRSFVPHQCVLLRPAPGCVIRRRVRARV
jgi:hypothetical protein